jgi:hypothetical protein
MAYTPSLREIPLTEEPHKSVLEALMPDPLSEDYAPVTMNDLNAEQAAHLAQCSLCRAELGLNGTSATGEL